MQHGKARRQLLDEINITPLTDVFLVLLIIMIVVAPMLKMVRSEILPPAVDGGTPIDKPKLVVEVTREGLYFVDGKQTNIESLPSALKAGGEHFAESDVVIRADRDTKGSAVMKVFDAAREAEFKKMTVAVETLSASRQEELKEKAVGPAAERGAAS